jgi:hypothetical protein
VDLLIALHFATDACCGAILYGWLRQRYGAKPPASDPPVTSDPPSHEYLYKWVRNKKIGNDLVRVDGWVCPMCISAFTLPKYINLHGAICDCLEFPRAHFHWNCPECKYTAVMRTANDPGK